MSQFLVNPFPFATAPPQGNFGSWKELGRVTLGAPATGMEVSSLPKKDYYWILFHSRFVAGGVSALRLNGDGAANYPQRFSANGAADTTDLTALNAKVGNNQTSGDDEFGSYFIDNTLEKGEHHINGHTVGSGNITIPSASAPDRLEAVSKWENPNEEFINTIRIQNLIGGNMDTGSQLIILGQDRKDTVNISQNFWEFLGSVVAPGSSTEISLLFATRKYLWIRIAQSQFGPQPINMDLQVGTGSADSGTKYSQAKSTNGGADATLTAQTQVHTDTNNVQRSIINNLIMVNPDGREKMCIMPQNTVSGPSPDPQRFEENWKFNETLNQINFIRLFRRVANGGLNAGSRIDVWGHD